MYGGNMKILRSIPERKHRFVGEQSRQQQEDPNKEVNDFKEVLRKRSQRRK